jgi:hypothetical protein
LAWHGTCIHASVVVFGHTLTLLQLRRNHPCAVRRDDPFP